MTLSPLSIQQQLDTLRDRYVQSIGDRIEGLAALWEALCADDWSWERLSALHSQAHALSGSAASFDLPAVSAAAQALVEALAQLIAGRPTEPSGESRARIAEAIAAVRAAPRDPPRVTRVPPIPMAFAAPTRALRQTDVLIVEDDLATGEHLALQLEHFGYHATVMQSLDGFEDAVRAHEPAAIILDIVFPEGDLAGPERMAENARAGVAAPVIFLSQRSDFTARLWAVRAGGRAYLTKPVDIDALVSVLDGVTGAFVPEPYRVLIVDDTRLTGALYEAMLRNAGMLTMALTDPALVMQALQEFQPDLLLLDMYMPDCTGPEVAALIRQQAAFVSLPIVFLSGEHDRDNQLAALDQGGDDFLTKPISAPQLVSAVTSRARRARAMRALLSRDGLTGLFTHASIKEQVLREIVRAQRYHTALTVAMIDLDHFKLVNDRYGHAAGDRVLKGLARLLHQRLRMSDSIGRYGGEEFLIILPQTDGPTALRLLDEARARFATIGHLLDADQEVTVTFSGGVASLVPTGDSRTLLASADAALYAAKRAGRNRIICATCQDATEAPTLTL
ncbi:diguanylate cyclase [Oscillochloris sp. ZM17-4]|uniref:diguanylate cyclase n=1 Tax=Oscillochloris sp. ZM17-4 TaxID=2866714 RepID=UPI001C72C72E|nr:diguanylate cyclase [Oscillochloris sp. ZM17-4]MBX0327393.1 diguanylate cyclase [Oscillochloris sp. ZM17-4]